MSPLRPEMRDEVARDVVENAEAALAKLEAALQRANDLGEHAHRRAVSQLLFPYRSRLRDDLPRLRAAMAKAGRPVVLQISGSGG